MKVARFLMPDGRTARFEVPDQTTPKNAQTLIEQYIAEQQVSEESSEEEGFLTRLGEDLKTRVQQSEEIKQAYLSGEQKLPQSVYQGITKVGAGGALDILGEAAVSGFRALPDVITQPVRSGAQAVAEFVQPAVQPIMEEYGKLSPKVRRNIEGTANILALATPVKFKAAPAMAETSVGKLGRKAVAAGDATRLKSITELIMPEPTKAVRETQIGQGRIVERGALKIKRVNPSIQEQEMAAEVFKIGEVGEGKSLLRNRILINREIIKESALLKLRLETHNARIFQEEIDTALTGAFAKLSDNIFLSGSVELPAKKIIAHTQKLIDINGYTASGLLQTRKDLDKWARAQKGGNIFDPAKDNAISASIAEIRQTLNNLIAEKVPDVRVKEMLKKQSTLFRALDNIDPKVASEANNLLSRIVHDIEDKIPIKGDAYKRALLVLGIGGAGTFISPAITGTVAATAATAYAIKGLRSPKAKKALGAILIQTDKAIRLTKDKDIIRQMRLDRAALLEMIQSMDTREDK